MTGPEIEFNREKGLRHNISIGGISILNCPLYPVVAKDQTIKSVQKSDDGKFTVLSSSETHEIIAEYDITDDRYVVCDFTITTIRDNETKAFDTGLFLNNNPVFKNRFQLRNMDKSDTRSYHRAISINFSSENPFITNSVDFLLEYVHDGSKVLKEEDNRTFVGWKLESKSFSAKGEKYSNRWMIHASSIDNSPSKVRGQRIYHWYGHYPPLPSFDLMEEMAEYGCTIMILHMPAFKWIDGSMPIDETEFSKVILKANAKSRIPAGNGMINTAIMAITATASMISDLLTICASSSFD